jgi:uncharacterized membrane protein YesL
MQVLGFVADLFIINVIFLICCLPIVTIGAAQAGLYNAMRVKQDLNNGRSVIKVFFEGFKDGFGTITLNSTLFLILDAVAAYTVLMAYSYQDTGLFIHWAIPTVILALSLMLHSLLPAFHSRFGCRPVELIRNCALLLFTHPVRAVAVTVLTWLPAGMFLFAPNLWLQIGALFITVYYSVAFLFCELLMKRPFKLLIDNMEKEATEAK